jgi:hypothetical protein
VTENCANNFKHKNREANDGLEYKNNGTVCRNIMSEQEYKMYSIKKL